MTKKEQAELEHLKLIDAHLERLLELASKRTPGEWVKNHENDTGKNDDSFWEWWEAGPARCEGVKGEADATFIASAAGNAEAGWRATRAAIALLFDMCDGAHSISTVIAAQKMGEAILAAFPIESLKP